MIGEKTAIRKKSKIQKGFACTPTVITCRIAIKIKRTYARNVCYNLYKRKTRRML
jgi:hypothetical protein